MSIPSNEDILALLAQLDDAIADALESEFLDFKPSLGPKEDLKVACEYAAWPTSSGAVRRPLWARMAMMWMCSSAAFMTARAQASRPRCWSCPCPRAQASC